MDALATAVHFPSVYTKSPHRAHLTPTSNPVSDTLRCRTMLPKTTSGQSGQVSSPLFFLTLEQVCLFRSEPRAGHRNTIGQVSYTRQRPLGHPIIDLDVSLSRFTCNQSLPCDWPGCRKSFKRKPDLNRHRNSVHEQLKKFWCPYLDCDRS